MVYKIYIPPSIHEAGKNFLIDKGYQIKISSGTTKEIIMDEARDCDAILARTETYSEEILRAAKRLKVIGRHGVGTDNIDVVAATKLGIQVTNAPASNANSVVEQVFTLMLSLAKNLPVHNREIRRGNFEIRNQLTGIDLENKTLGIIGMGKIGKSLAERANKGLMMNVIGYDPFLTEFPDQVEMVSEWEPLFRQADFISLHLPLTPATKGLITRREFELMKETAFFINTSRGEVVKEQDLVDALKNKVIRGAGLDVFETEPPAPDHELFSMDQVIVTPHNAALTVESLKKMSLHAAIGIHEVLTGHVPTWPVNRLPVTLAEKQIKGD